MSNHHYLLHKTTLRNRKTADLYTRLVAYWSWIQWLQQFDTISDRVCKGRTLLCIFGVTMGDMKSNHEGHLELHHPSIMSYFLVSGRQFLWMKAYLDKSLIGVLSLPHNLNKISIQPKKGIFASQSFGQTYLHTYTIFFATISMVIWSFLLAILGQLFSKYCFPMDS